ncbi:lipase family alpha/beta hydrolase [Aquirhabdus parva]|uniref:Triacylglycerol lipase n=1 Tax=Aquirhabdus parva TaxID=2283318 RepID=A0A345P905_9GAMM|nr:triacylglycerol lipase [Aquirhabdus parva]AXI03764.1 triacylglycerol lipase [Aquirhabdus parva]
MTKIASKIVPALTFGAILLTPVLVSAVTVPNNIFNWWQGPQAVHENCAINNGQAVCQQSSALDQVTVTSNYAQTKYPIVLAHGLFGFGQIGPINYWHGIPQDLGSNGANVFVTTVSSGNSDAVRGEQLLKQVIAIRALTGSDKVNLIGHSQGVQSVRYVAGVRPDLVASVTGIAGSNTGSPVADAAQLVLINPLKATGLDSIVAGAVNFFLSLEGVASGAAADAPQDIVAANYGLTTKGAAEFNVLFPQAIPTTPCGPSETQANGVNYYSWGGTGLMTNAFDSTSYGMVAASLLQNGPSDGLVPKCSSHLGQVIRDDYPQNHLDEVNQVLGMVGSGPGADPIPLYRQQANRLKVAGF